MREYKVIYPFEVYDKIKEGKNVGLTDRAAGKVYVVNVMTVEKLADVLRRFDEVKGRFEFWVEEEREETEE